MSVADSLTAWGLPRAPEIVELAATAGLALPVAATLLVKESGGRNVWGHDGVDTGGAYTKGAEVTREDYLAYRVLVRDGRIGRQGVGPTQLTYHVLQDRADDRGGCWDWRTNVAVGFEHLARLQRAVGVRDGFRRYNGSGPAAERYADDAMTELGRWRDRLGNPPSP
ncbi:MAG: hypothetical protein L0H84_20780, partial [Pseudonocardia sp.]|nr:hypothetical protein [Pseudonocardia sp.]